MFSSNGGKGLRGWASLPRPARARLLAGVVLIGYAAVTVGPALSAAAGHGARGYFVAQSLNCGRTCSWTGEFRLPDGRVTRTDVSFGGDESNMQAGTVVPALDTGDFAEVFPRRGDTSWLLDLALGVCGIALIGYQAVSWMGQRRTGARGAALPDEPRLPRAA